MIIYLTDTHIGNSINSKLKSSGKVMAFYFTVLFPIVYFCTRVGFSLRSFPCIHRILPDLCVRDLLSGISFTLNILILST